MKPERTIRVTLTGDALDLVNELIRQGMTEDEIMAKALTLLRMATESQVAQVDQSGQVQGIFRVS